jgi:hypothetical protein
MILRGARCVERFVSKGGKRGTAINARTARVTSATA